MENLAGADAAQEVSSGTEARHQARQAGSDAVTTHP